LNRLELCILRFSTQQTSLASRRSRRLDDHVQASISNVPPLVPLPPSRSLGTLTGLPGHRQLPLPRRTFASTRLQTRHGSAFQDPTLSPSTLDFGRSPPTSTCSRRLQHHRHTAGTRQVSPPRRNLHHRGSIHVLIGNASANLQQIILATRASPRPRTGRAPFHHPATRAGTVDIYLVPGRNQRRHPLVTGTPRRQTPATSMSQPGPSLAILPAGLPASTHRDLRRTPGHLLPARRTSSHRFVAGRHPRHQVMHRNGLSTHRHNRLIRRPHRPVDSLRANPDSFIMQSKRAAGRFLSGLSLIFGTLVR